MSNKDEFRAIIKSNIDKYSYHVTVVNSHIEPRYAYTIGLYKVLGFELIFAGGIYFMKDDLMIVFDATFNYIKSQKNFRSQRFNVNSLGVFSLSRVDSTWSDLTMLGVFDYYERKDIKALQILPDSTHYTLDIPDMSTKFNSSLEPIWKWLTEEWNYPIPHDSTVVTNLNALKGELITEVMRWEHNEWEMFSGAGPDVLEKDKRVVSMGTLMGIDESVKAAVDLDVGKGMWRDPNERVWHAWN